MITYCVPIHSFMTFLIPVILTLSFIVAACVLAHLCLYFPLLCFFSSSPLVPRVIFQRHAPQNKKKMKQQRLLPWKQARATCFWCATADTKQTNKTNKHKTLPWHAPGCAFQFVRLQRSVPKSIVNEVTYNVCCEHSTLSSNDDFLCKYNSVWIY